MTTGPPSTGPPEEVQEPIGRALARLRNERGLTGTELGRLVDMSQAKISKIETGTLVPSADDVVRIAQALDAPPEVVQRLAERADNAHDQVLDWRLLPGGPATGRSATAKAEAESAEIRGFHTGVISGLLQTVEYVRAMFATSSGVPVSLFGQNLRIAEVETVALRLRRQQILADRSKTFSFVMTEGALQHPMCGAADMPSQIERIRQVSRQENVTIGFLPIGPQPVTPLHSFSIAGDRLVMIDLLNTALMTRGRADIQFYRRVFDAFEREADTDIDPILDRYLNIYLDLARPGRQPGRRPSRDAGRG